MLAFAGLQYIFFFFLFFSFLIFLHCNVLHWFSHPRQKVATEALTGTCVSFSSKNCNEVYFELDSRLFKYGLILPSCLLQSSADLYLFFALFRGTALKHAVSLTSYGSLSLSVKQCKSLLHNWSFYNIHFQSWWPFDKQHCMFFFVVFFTQETCTPFPTILVT